MSAVRASISSLQYLSLIFPSQKFNLSIWSACLPCPHARQRNHKWPWKSQKNQIGFAERVQFYRMTCPTSVFTPCVAVKVWCPLLAPEHLCHTGLELQKAPQRCLTSPPLRTGYSRFTNVSHVFYRLSSPLACCLAGCCSGAFQRYRSVIPHSEIFILFRWK